MVMKTPTPFFALVLSIIVYACAEKETKSQDQDFCLAVHGQDSVTLSGALKPYDQKLKDKTGVFVLEDGGGSLVTRAWFAKHAEKTIDIQYFIFSTDNIGLLACDYLVRAADRGVKVRMIVDDIMVDAEVSDILTMAAHPNIEIKVYNPGINLGKSLVGKLAELATNFRGANQRMHNKTFIVDGRVAVTGGRNIADEYYDYNRAYNFRDRDVLLMGKEVKSMSGSFERFWASEISVKVEEVVAYDNQVEFTPDLFEPLHQYACNPENFWPKIRREINGFHNTLSHLMASNQFHWVDSVTFISDEPGKNEEADGLGGGGISTTTLVKLINEARISD